MDPKTIASLRDLALAYLSLLGCLVLLVPLVGFSLAFLSLGRLKVKVQSYLHAFYQKVVKVEKTIKSLAQLLERGAQVVARFLSKVSRMKRG